MLKTYHFDFEFGASCHTVILAEAHALHDLPQSRQAGCLTAASSATALYPLCVQRPPRVRLCPLRRAAGQRSPGPQQLPGAEAGQGSRRSTQDVPAASLSVQGCKKAEPAPAMERSNSIASICLWTAASVQSACRHFCSLAVRQSAAACAQSHGARSRGKAKQVGMGHGAAADLHHELERLTSEVILLGSSRSGLSALQQAAGLVEDLVVLLEV